MNFSLLALNSCYMGGTEKDSELRSMGKVELAKVAKVGKSTLRNSNNYFLIVSSISLVLDQLTNYL